MRGARLVSVGGVPADRLVERLRPWVSVENEPGLHAAVSQALFNTAVLSDSGIVPVAGPVALTLRMLNGTERRVELAPVPYGQIDWAPYERLPWYREEHASRNWLRDVPGGHATYVHYGACEDEAGNARIAAELKARLQGDAAWRVVIDLRGNTGGDSAALKPVLRVLKGRTGGQRVIALTDRQTFSSGFRNAAELKSMGATVMGEPSGQRPVYTGDVKSFQLTYSRLTIRYTTKWSRLGPAEAMEMVPDIVLQPTASQYLAGDDPVLAAALVR